MRASSYSRLLAILAVAPWILLGSPAPAQTSSKHFLWRVTSVSQPFYILGSFHALRASDYPLGREIDQAIGDSKRFVFEYDFKHADASKFDRDMNKLAHYPSGTTLKQKLRPETYAYVQKIAKTRASSYNDTKPWAIAFFMMSHPYYYNVYSYYGVEGYVMRKARLFPDIGGLETPEEHIHVLSDMSDIEGEVFLLQAFVYSDRDAANMSKLVAAYKQGETEEVVASEAQRDHEAPFITWRLIDHRNAQWIPRIEQEMKSGKPTMIVVGARHLCGPHSVISMLQAKGYKLEQL